MAASVTRPPIPAIVLRPEQTVTVTRVRFVAEAPAGAKVRREFKHPRRMVAVEEAVEPADLPTSSAGPEPADHCCIVFIPPGAAGDWLKHAGAWMAPPNRP